MNIAAARAHISDLKVHQTRSPKTKTKEVHSMRPTMTATETKRGQATIALRRIKILSQDL